VAGPVELSDPRGARLAEQLLSSGSGTVALTPLEAASLQAVYSASAEFFARPMPDKVRHGAGMFGFREVESGYSQSPDRPDRHEAFSLWSTSADGIPEPAGVSELTASMLSWREVVADIARNILAALACTFDAAPELTFASASYVQANHYLSTAAEREFLQDAHEDGHLLTILSANAAGLEILDEAGVPHPVEPGPDEGLVMPGSLLTAMSGGRIAPLFHQVRNLALLRRTTILYFVNPQLDVELRPWVIDDTNAEVDVRELARTNPNAFGLPDLPEL
jgi:isopenicillin N synthase-like dioxygenase